MPAMAGILVCVIMLTMTLNMERLPILMIMPLLIAVVKPMLLMMPGNVGRTEHTRVQ